MCIKLYVTLDGLEGTGKSTIVSRLKEDEDIIREVDTIITTKEPGYTKIGNDIRAILLNNPHEVAGVDEADEGKEVINSTTDVLLYYADRIQKDIQIRKVLEQSYKDKSVLILSDRSEFSTKSYQRQGANSHVVNNIHDVCKTQLLTYAVPSERIVIDIQVNTMYDRISHTRFDDIEKSPRAFFENIRTNLKELVHESGESVTLIDGEKTLDEVYNSVKEAIIERLRLEKKGGDVCGTVK